MCLADKVCQICLDSDSDISAFPVDVTSTTVCLFSQDSFQLVDLKNVDRVLGMVQATTCSLNPCPSWLIKSVKVNLWLREERNSSLKEVYVPVVK